MPKKTNITLEDLDAFYQAVKGTKPLPQNKIRLNPTPPAKPIKRQAVTYQEPLLFTDSTYHEPVPGDAFIAYHQTGISNKILRKLRKGQYNVDAKLDLHGMTVEEARLAVNEFLQLCLNQGMRVVLIIHGKGHHSRAPILKNKLNHWLREINMVLAFCSAATTHGSRGAIYILLKRTREER